MKQNKEDNILAEIRPATSIAVGRPYELRGNVNILLGKELMVLGPFEGALFLWPSIEELCSGIFRMNQGETQVEIVLVGDSPSLWIISRTYRSGRVTILSYRGRDSVPLSTVALEKAVGDAISEFIKQRRQDCEDVDVRAVIHNVTNFLQRAGDGGR